jgi:formyltetrahydrofolate deformylase
MAISFYIYQSRLTPKHNKNPKSGSMIAELKIDFVVLARYMQILSEDFCNKLPGKIINIHHSFLPGFKGAKPYHQAHDRGVKIIGASAHFVTSDLDEGPIIEQDVAHVTHVATPEELIAIWTRYRTKSFI